MTNSSITSISAKYGAIKIQNIHMKMVVLCINICVLLQLNMDIELFTLCSRQWLPLE